MINDGLKYTMYITLLLNSVLIYLFIVSTIECDDIKGRGLAAELLISVVALGQ